ncbi:MAG: prenyltransferase/squalene oxidase repeat-containing protein [bacterium]
MNMYGNISKKQPSARKFSVLCQFVATIFLISLISTINPRTGWGKTDQPPAGEPKKTTDSKNMLKQESRDISLQKEAQHSIDIGLNWLKSKQNKDGSWSSPDYPAVTALAVLGFLRDPSSSAGHNQYSAAVKKALKYIMGKVQPDGGIYTPDKGLATYNTSICLTALVATGDPAYNDTIQKARNFLVSLQQDEGKAGVVDNLYDGGIGYGGKEKHSDMSNMYFAIEALRVSEKRETDQKEKPLDLKQVQSKDLDWQAALRFIERCQNNPQSNDQPWASSDPNNYGGFVYFPGSSKAGEEKLPDGKTTLRSYGSMTYAGLLSFIYAQVKKDDPRVRAAYDWIRNHYTLEENPGLGLQGLYYNYHTMAKALAVYGEEEFQVKGRQDKVNWRKELLAKLISVQKGDGYWVNDQGRWWENDPALVTSYAILTMEIALAGY